MMRCVLVAFVLSGFLASLQGASSWPVVQGSLDSIGGIVLLNDAPAMKNTMFPAEGVKLTTGPDGFATLMLSTGLTVYLGPSSSLIVTEARQLEYVDIYFGGEFEESRSDVTIKLTEGRFGFVQLEPDPTSTLKLKTRYGDIEGDAREFVILLEGGSNSAAALVGNLYYIHDTGARRFVTEGEALDLQQVALDNSTDALQKLLATGRLRYEPVVAPALKSARRTLFRVTNGEPAFIIAVPRGDVQGAAFNDYRTAN